MVFANSTVFEPFVLVVGNQCPTHSLMIYAGTEGSASVRTPRNGQNAAGPCFGFQHQRNIPKGRGVCHC